MIQYNTTNTSFIKLHYVLKEMGIKNNDFFLRLNNKELLNVNPRDDNLPLDLKLMVLDEIKSNVWYYAREVVRIPAGGGEIQFKAHKLSIATIWCLINNLNTIVQGPRQTGKTTAVALTYGWFFYFGANNTEMALYGISEELLKRNVNRIKDIRGALPKYLQLVSKKDTDNASQMRTNRDDGSFNNISIKATGKSEEAARNVGRGMSTACQWYDEFAFIEHVQAQYETAVYAYSSVARVAAERGSPHHICLTTTAGFLDTPHGQWAYRMIKNAAPFSEKLYDMCEFDATGKPIYDMHSIRQYINNNSSTGGGLGSFTSVEYMYYDLDVGPNYLEEMRGLVESEDAFRREVLMEWRSTSADHPLGQERVAKLQTMVKKPVDVIVIDNLYFLNIYGNKDDIDWNFPLVCGMDVGTNTGSDFTALVFTDPRTFEVVATMRSNHHTVPKFLRALQYILTEIFPNAILIVERNGVGGPVAQLLDSFLPPSRLYHDDKDMVGIALTKPLRDLLFNEVLKASVIEELEKIHDRYIISEIVTLRLKNGRIDHEDGKHDDTLIAYLYTKWFLTFCTTRGKYIDPVLIGCNRNLLYNKEELDKIFKNAMADAKEGILDFALGRTGPKFESTDTGFDKLRKQNDYLRKILNNEMDTRSADKAMDGIYTKHLDLRKEMIKDIDSYSILEDDLEKYINPETEDKLDTEEINEELKKNADFNKEKSNRFKTSDYSVDFKSSFY